jgi:hypothetical protein
MGALRDRMEADLRPLGPGSCWSAPTSTASSPPGPWTSRGLGGARPGVAGSLLLGDEVQLPRGLSGRRLLRTLRRRKWVVYARRPLRGPSRTPPLRGLRRSATKATSGSCLRSKTAGHLVEYLGRYTHRVAISDARVLDVDGGGLTFRTRGEQVCRLDDASSIRRFVQHVLPRALRKIRHCGLYAPSSVGRRLEQARALLGLEDDEPASEEVEQAEQDADWRALLLRLAGIDLRRCPRCGARAVVVEPLGAWPAGLRIGGPRCHRMTDVALGRADRASARDWCVLRHAFGVHQSLSEPIPAGFGPSGVLRPPRSRSTPTSDACRDAESGRG